MHPCWKHFSSTWKHSSDQNYWWNWIKRDGRDISETDGTCKTWQNIFTEKPSNSIYSKHWMCVGRKKHFISAILFHFWRKIVLKEIFEMNQSYISICCKSLHLFLLFKNSIQKRLYSFQLLLHSSPCRTCGSQVTA